MLTETVAGKFGIEEFLAFLEFRPKGERWDLIDGVAFLMQRPTLAHRRIGTNFILLLNSKLAASAVDAFAYQEVAIGIPAMDDFLPRPDVAVGPGFAGYECYSDYFLLVAEILSPTNTRREIESKLRRYFAAPHCRYALVIDPKKIEVEVFTCTGAWQSQKLSGIEQGIELPEFEFRCTVGDLYHGTPLNPSRRGEYK